MVMFLYLANDDEELARDEKDLANDEEELVREEKDLANDDEERARDEADVVADDEELVSDLGGSNRNSVRGALGGVTPYK